MTSEEINKALAKGLDTDGLLRLAAVDMTIDFFKNFQTTDLKYFNEQYEKIYNFLKTKSNG